MPKPGERKVNRTATYVRADGRYVPAIITGLGAGAIVDLRVGHTGGDAFTSVGEMIAADDVSVWLPGSRRRYPNT